MLTVFSFPAGPFQQNRLFAQTSHDSISPAPVVVKKKITEGNISMGFQSSKGNVNQTMLRLETGLSNLDTVWEYAGAVKFSFDKADQKTVNKEFYGIFKLDYLPFHTLSGFMLVSGMHNQFKGIDKKISLLGGVKLSYFQKYSDPANRSNRNFLSQYSISAAFQFDEEEFIESVENKNRESLKLSVRSRLKQKFMDRIILENTTFYRVELGNYQDYRIENLFKISDNISKHLQFSISFEYEFVSRPPVSEALEIKRVDSAIVSSVVFRI